LRSDSAFKTSRLVPDAGDLARLLLVREGLGFDREHLPRKQAAVETALDPDRAASLRFVQIELRGFDVLRGGRKRSFQPPE
jgi:hypothetical protein